MQNLVKNICCGITLAAVDFIVFFSAPNYATVLLFKNDFNAEILDLEFIGWSNVHGCLAICYIAWCAHYLRHYIYRKSFWLEIKDIIFTLIMFAVIEIVFLVFIKGYYLSYLWVVSWLLISTMMPFTRMGTKHLLNKHRMWQRDAYIIGDGKNALDIYHALKDDANFGFHIMGFISPEYNIDAQKNLADVPVTVFDNALLQSSSKSIQMIVAMEQEQEVLRNTWLRKLMINGYRHVYVIPSIRGLPLENTDMSFIFRHDAMVFCISQRVTRLFSRMTKRAFDILASSAIIILISPLLLYIAMAIRKNDGSAIYHHPRVGKNGKQFNCLKFRTMVTNSKEVLEQTLATNPEAKKEWNVAFKLKNDPRVTRIGSYLRERSLDELPQLFNVIRGEMSLVGPRPIIAAELERYGEDVDYYLLVKPGMTGLWQVSGRSDIAHRVRR